MYQTKLLVELSKIVSLRSDSDSCLEVALSDQKLVVCLLDLFVMLVGALALVRQQQLLFQDLNKAIDTSLLWLFDFCIW